VKLVVNCENMLFQRPDDAIHRGLDKQAELDLATPGTFISNFEPLDVTQAQSLVDRIVEFDRYTEPMKRLLLDFVANPRTGYVVSSAHPRLVDGKPSKNPRYLQRRPDLVNARATYLAEIGTRLDRRIPSDAPVWYPVHAVLPGMRNNPPEPAIGLPPLAVFSPIHYLDVPELFMGFIASLTGKSPSTTGFGSEGALTKGPFNALWPVVDLNNALTAAILTEYPAFITAAGHVGPRYRVDHDITMIVPEVWCRMQPAERDPKFLIERGYLEKLEDFDHKGERVSASILGYRITGLFADHFLGRIFETPDAIFTDDLLRPETQDLPVFVAGVRAIVAGYREAARLYFDDGSIRAACPPLCALLHIMAHGHYEGRGLGDPEIRAMFSREALLASDWYHERLRTKQQRDMALLKNDPRVVSASYLEELVGTIGADPFHNQ
jgi:hypothetical protein